MAEKVKIGVFGAMRGMALINVLAHHPEADLVAICDKYANLNARCEKVAKETGSNITFYTDFEDFFKHDMDAVVLANYANEHAPFAIRLLRSGRHVISELLPCETMAQAVELVEAVEESGKIYAYAENCCYYNGVQEMKKRFRAGEIGELTHAEGEYIHDCESIWPRITYGDPTHWRNRMYATFYCTHSLGPIITATGLRPVRVIGMENQRSQALLDLGYKSAISGVFLVEMENGATVKNMNGNLKREPAAHWFSIYGTEGCLETDRWEVDAKKLHVFHNGEEKYFTVEPQPEVIDEIAQKTAGHGGADFYTMHYFLEKIQGKPGGAESIDVYTALDMYLPGLLAHRSILNGNIPIEVPNLRRKSERDKYRNDHACTNPAVAGDQLVPQSHHPDIEIPDSTYEHVKEIWETKFKPTIESVQELPKEATSEEDAKEEK